MSMEAVHKALTAFWSSFTYTAPDGSTQPVDAFLSGHVPKEKDNGQPVTYPYITFETANGEGLSSTVLTAFDWHQASINGPNVMTERTRLMDDIARAIPKSGRRIRLEGGGSVTIYRNGADFQRYYDDPVDKTVIGGRTSYEIHFYYN